MARFVILVAVFAVAAVFADAAVSAAAVVPAEAEAEEADSEETESEESEDRGEQKLKVIECCAKQTKVPMVDAWKSFQNGVVKKEYGCFFKCFFNAWEPKWIGENGKLNPTKEMTRQQKKCIGRILPCLPECQKAAAYAECLV